jgi:Tol biopolymer transport system component
LSSGRIGFVGARQEDSDYSFFVMKADGSNQIRLAPALIGPPSADVWSPDRRTLAFLDRDFPSHKYWFSLVDIDGRNQRKVTDLSEFLPMSWSWSGDGKHLFMLCSTGGQAEPKPTGGIDERHYFDIFGLDINSGQIKRLTDARNVSKSSPVSSPDGTRIAFSGGENDPATWAISSYGIWVVNSDGSNQTRLLNISAAIRSFQWSPDGKRIVYCAYDEKKGLNDADVYVLDIETGASINLTNSPDIGDLDPLWSPDGSKLAICSGTVRGGYRLRVMGTDGKSVTELFDLANSFRAFASWSPDGKKILFTPGQTLYSAAVDGKNLAVLYQDSGTYRDILCPVWLPQ